VFILLSIASSALSTPASAAVKLNATPVDGGDVKHFYVAPDGGRVVYYGDLTEDEALELYSRPIDRSASQVRLTDLPASFPGNGAINVRIAPDSSRAVYGGYSTAGPNLDDIYSVPVVGSDDPVQINSSTGSLAVQGFKVTGGSDSRVVYQGDLTMALRLDLFSKPVDGSGSQVQISSSASNPNDVDIFKLSADNQYVAYVGDLTTDGVPEIYAAPVDGSGPQTRLNDAPVSGGGIVDDLFVADNYRNTFQITPDSQHVIYRGDLDQLNTDELYSAPIDGSGSQVKLNTSSVSGGEVLGMRVTSDSQRVVYRGELTRNGAGDLYSAPVDGSGPQIRLTDFTGSDSVGDFYLTPDGSLALFEGPGSQGPFIYSVPVDGSASPTPITGIFPGGDLENIQITSDSQRMVYTEGGTTLYSTPVDTATETFLAYFDSDTEIRDVQLTDDGAYAVFTIREGGSLHDGALYAVDVLGNDDPMQLNNPLPLNGEISDFTIVPSSHTVIYQADGDQLGRYELYTTAIPEPASAAVLMLGALATLHRRRSQRVTE
jgi:hypothetical protein